MTLVDGLNKCSNLEYHADKTYLSSSSYKLLLTDLPKFYKEKILNEIEPQEDKPYFVEGSYVHTLILEPEMVAKEYAFFDGKTRSGKEWQEFKKANPGLQLMTLKQKERCEKWLEAYAEFKTMLNPIRGGESEQTICGIYKGIKTKVRFDYINVERGYIVDVKTSAMPVDLDSFKVTVEKYMYDLSAALYLQLAETYYGKRFDFYFLCIGKSDNNCQLYRLSENSRLNGQRNLERAAAIYKNCLLSNNWDDSVVTEYEIQDV